MRQLVSSLLKRLPWIAALSTGVMLCWVQASRSGGMLDSFPWIVFAVAQVVVIGIIVGWPFAAFFAIPFERIYFPHEEEKPKPAYQLAEWYLDHWRFEDALFEYEKILKYHPRELVARCLQIELLMARLDEPERARKSFRRGMRLLRSEEDRGALAAAYAKAQKKVRELAA